MAMSKIDRIDREIEKTRGKITEYQNRLKELEAQRTEQENFEIVNLVRSMCMSRDELMNFLRGGANDAPPITNRRTWPMTKNKHFRSVFAALLCAVLCMTAFATVAYADGGDYYDDELPPETWQEETQPEDNTIAPGTPFTEDGIAATRDLLYDKHTNKQFITVETRNGHTLYIVIDYDKLLDEEEERYQTYFLNPVDEADLMALLEDDSQNTPVVCSCTEKCTAGKVNTNCALCKTDMTNCAGKEATPEKTEQPDEPTPEKNNNVGGIMILVLILAAGSGGALWYFKLRKPKSSVKGGDELDEFDFDEDDEAEEYGDYEDADSASDPDKQENEE